MTAPAARRTASLSLGPGAVAVLIGGVAVGWFAFGAATAARRPLGWALACGVAAAVLTPVVEALHERRVPRPLAVLLVFLGVGAAAGALTFGVLRDLDDQVERLKDTAPEAAADLADSPGMVGDVANDIDLPSRVEAIIDELEEPSSGVAARAASSAGAWFVSIVLTAFFLSWGPRLGAAGLRQIGDDRRRDRTGRIARAAVNNGRRYLLDNLLLAFVAGFVAWGVCDLEGAPAPLPLGVAVAAGSIVPGVGIAVGALPAILLEAGVGTGAGAARLTVAFVALQVGHTIALRRFVTRRSLAVGPAAIVIALVLGYDLYGVGGAYYSAALAVFGLAALDAAGREAKTEATPTPSS